MLEQKTNLFKLMFQNSIIVDEDLSQILLEFKGLIYLKNYVRRNKNSANLHQYIVRTTNHVI